MAKQKRTDAERRARQCERIGRVLRVLQLVLSKGSPWDAKAIATELEVSERTIYRDIQTLQMAGVPIYHDEQVQGYRVRPGFRLNGLDEIPRASRSSSAASETPADLADATVNAAKRILVAAEEVASLLENLRDSLRPKGSKSGHAEPRKKST